MKYWFPEIMQISARGILATIAASAGQNGHFSKVWTVYVYLLSNFRFDKYRFNLSVL
jgi:hypothetical protein